MKVFFDGKEINDSKPITSKSLELPPAVFFWTHQKVNDELRGYIIKSDGKWTFISPLRYLLLRNGHENLPALKKIALILESPNIYEYYFDGMPIRPANGETGRKIQDYLVDKLSANKFPFNDDEDYAVLLVNPVQYQSSCYHQLHSQGFSSNQDLKNKVFRKLFSYLKSDFQKRMQSYDPDYIINACTGGIEKSLQNTVYNALSVKLKGKVVLSVTHPSDW